MNYIPPLDREIKDFYRNHADAVYRGCCFLTAGQGDPEELTRDVFLKLLEKGLEFSSDKDARAWMLMTAGKLGKKAKPKQNAPAEETREEKTSDPKPEEIPAEAPEVTPEQTEAIQEPETPAEADTAVTEAPPEQTAEPATEVSEAPQEPSGEETEHPVADPLAGVGKLSRKNRLTALFYYCEGYRKAEVASYLGCTTMSVSGRLRKIKKLFPEETGMIRRDIRDAYQSTRPTMEQKEAILGRILAEKPSAEGIRGRKWKPKGQLPSWIAIILSIALVISAAGYGLYHHGYIDLAMHSLAQLRQELAQTQPTEPSEDPAQSTTSGTLPEEETGPVDARTLYAPLVATYVTAINEGWNHNRCDLEHISTLVANLDKPGQLRYGLLDLDQDGSQELLITDGTVIYDMYCLDGKSVRHLITGAERNSYSLTKDLMILNTGSNGAANTIFSVYSYFGGNLILYDQLVFDGEKDPVNPWFHGFGMKSVTEEEAEEILVSYEIQSMNLPPIDEYPGP